MFQTLPELHCQYLSGGNNAFKPWYIIVEVLMVNPGNNIVIYGLLLLGQV